MGVREKTVELHLDKEVKKLGGITRKWTSPGRDGVPDRIVIFPEGVSIYVYNVFFVEIKTIDGKLTKRQEREIAELNRLGADARVVYGEEGVDQFIKDVTTVSFM